ncbi:hypothetical protein SAMN05443661_1014 [Natronobacterium gregoryi]|uniref:Uncharacterized protein n=2 Tax=Natronobacterium gregoryi TaxID=44930 RepID=L0AL11_NATGS|nr:hypothetical protein Natgr_2984 [Natronobacterium gregoryi SP2]SFI49795.1 hypothetical protein SAMN05443661_1014 [Natronobacterium gregoryi]
MVRVRKRNSAPLRDTLTDPLYQVAEVIGRVLVEHRPGGFPEIAVAAVPEHLPDLRPGFVAVAYLAVLAFSDVVVLNGVVQRAGHG